MKKETKQLLLGCALGTAAALMQGCSFMGMERMAVSEDQGLMYLSADRPTIEAMGDVLTGLVNVGKATPDTATEHHELRRQQNQTRALRLTFGAKKQEAK